MYATHTVIKPIPINDISEKYPIEHARGFGVFCFILYIIMKLLIPCPVWVK